MPRALNRPHINPITEIRDELATIALGIPVGVRLGYVHGPVKRARRQRAMLSWMLGRFASCESMFEMLLLRLALKTSSWSRLLAAA